MIKKLGHGQVTLIGQKSHEMIRFNYLKDAEDTIKMLNYTLEIISFR
jgi:hypothetical protein